MGMQVLISGAPAGHGQPGGDCWTQRRRQDHSDEPAGRCAGWDRHALQAQVTCRAHSMQNRRLTAHIAFLNDGLHSSARCIAVCNIETSLLLASSQI